MKLFILSYKSLNYSRKYNEIKEIYFNDDYIQKNRFNKLHNTIKNIILIKYTYDNFHFLNCKLHNLDGFAVYDPNDCKDLKECYPKKANFYAINGYSFDYNDWKNNPIIKKHRLKSKIKSLIKI